MRHWVARIRTIKPEFPQSESMGRVSRDARLLFIMLWTLVDDHGRTRANPVLLANLLFPYDDDAKLRIPEWLTELERQKCIVVYSVDDNAYLQIEKWSEHQRIDHPGKSKFPSPPENLGKFRKKVRESRKNTPRTKDQGRDQGQDAETAGNNSFEDFWKVYPRKDDRIGAVKAWDRAIARVSPETIIAGAAAYAASRVGQDRKFTKQPETWLNKGSWENEDCTQKPILSPEEIAANEARREKLFGPRKISDAA